MVMTDVRIRVPEEMESYVSAKGGTGRTCEKCNVSVSVYKEFNNIPWKSSGDLGDSQI